MILWSWVRVPRWEYPIFFCIATARFVGQNCVHEDQLLWRRWQRVGLIIPRSPVRSWSGAYKCLYSSVWQSMRLVSARSRVRSSLEAVRVGVVGNISACHADAPGSIPGRGVFFSITNFGPGTVFLIKVFFFPDSQEFCLHKYRLYSSVGRASPS